MAGEPRRAFERQFSHDIHHRSDKRRSPHCRFPFHCHRCSDTGPQACGGWFCSFDHGAERAFIFGRSVQPSADKQEFEFAGDSRRRMRAAPRDQRLSDPGMRPQLGDGRVLNSGRSMSARQDGFQRDDTGLSACAGLLASGRLGFRGSGFDDADDPWCDR